MTSKNSLAQLVFLPKNVGCNGSSYWDNHLFGLLEVEKRIQKGQNTSELRINTLLDLPSICMANNLGRELAISLIVTLAKSILSLGTNAKGLTYHVLGDHPLRLPSHCILKLD